MTMSAPRADARLTQLANLRASARGSATLTPALSRALFRLMARRASGGGGSVRALTHSELQAGLLAMGFREANNGVVMSRLMMRIDVDKSGSISETDFVRFFASLQVADLGRRLAELAPSTTPGGPASPDDDAGGEDDGTAQAAARRARRVRITAVVVSAAGAVTEHAVPVGQLAEFFQAHGIGSGEADPVRGGAGAAEQRVWLDVCGASDDVARLLALTLGLHMETLCDAHIFQRQKVEVLRACERGSGAPVPPPPLPAEAPGLPPAAPPPPPVAASDAHVATCVHMLLHAVSLVNAGAAEAPSLSRRAWRTLRGCVRCFCGCGVGGGGGASVEEGHEAHDEAAQHARALDAAELLAQSFAGAAAIAGVSMHTSAALGAGNDGAAPPPEPVPAPEPAPRSRMCCCWSRARTAALAPAGAVAELELHSKAHLQAHPPALAIEQFSLLIASESLLVTVRPALGGGDANCVLGILFAGLRARLRGTAADARVLAHASSVRALALDIVDAVFQFNAGVRDELLGWHQLLETAILNAASPEHSLHLFALRKATGAFLRNAHPVRGAFAAARARSDKAARKAAARRNSISDGSSGGGGKRGHHHFRRRDAQDEGDTLADGDVLSLREFFAAEDAALDELGDELEMQLADLEGLQHETEHLQTLRMSLQDEARNSVLFVLTSATVFGMR